MKKLLLCLSLLVSFCANSQTVASSCTAPDSVVKRYKKDADRLALRREFYTNSTYEDSVRLDNSLRSTYLEALLAVYNATLLPIRDTIVNLYAIKTKPDPELNTFSVTASPTNAWMQNLQNSVIPTGYAPIDQFISKYHLNQTGYYQSTQYDVVIFTADSNYNIAALSHTAAAITSVLGASPYVVYNDERNITDSINPAFTMLAYSYGWGTCYNGCDFRTYWTFKVYKADCKVEYMGYSGNAIGSGTNTVGFIENQAAFNDVVMYPNPANDRLQLKMADAGKTIDLELSNALGQMVLKQTLEADNRELNIKALPAGIYYLKLSGTEGSRVFKILKE